MSKQWLSEERTQRLAELRAKYPKPVPAPPLEHYRSYLLLSLRFDFKALSQEEAERAAFDWMWHQGSEASDMLMRRFARDGLRDASVVYEAKGARIPEPEDDDEILENDDEGWWEA